MPTGEVRKQAGRTEKPNLDALTGIRFFAALHVVLYHFAPKTAGFASLPGWLQQFIFAGPASVGLFFVLSGFIMSYTYADRHTSKADFWIARFARIYPLYLAAFLLFAPFAYLKYHNEPVHFASAGLLTATLLQAWTNQAVDWNAPGWSLSAEVFFYLVFPFVLPVLRNVSKPRSVAYMAALYAAGLLAPAAYTAGYITPGTWHGWLMYSPLIWLPAFLIGILMERSGIRTGKLTGAAAAIAILAFLALCPLADQGISESPSAQSLLSHGALTLLFGILISSLTKWTTFLSLAPVVLLGEASYALYIFHVPLWNLLVGAFTYVVTGKQTNHASHAVILLVYILVSIAISIACFRWIEQPSRQWLKRRLTRHPSSPLRPQVSAYWVAPHKITERS